MTDPRFYAAARRLLVEHEGYRDTVYTCTAGKPTIGIGHNLEVPIPATAIEAIFAHDLGRVEQELDSYLPWWRTQDEVRRLALADLCFNLGIIGLLRFRNTLRAWMNGDYEGAAAGLIDSKWYGQVGRRGPRIVGMVRDGVMPE